MAAKFDDYSTNPHLKHVKSVREVRPVAVNSKAKKLEKPNDAHAKKKPEMEIQRHLILDDHIIN